MSAVDRSTEARVDDAAPVRACLPSDEAHCIPPVDLAVPCSGVPSAKGALELHQAPGAAPPLVIERTLAVIGMGGTMRGLPASLVTWPEGAGWMMEPATVRLSDLEDEDDATRWARAIDLILAWRDLTSRGIHVDALDPDMVWLDPNDGSTILRVAPLRAWSRLIGRAPTPDACTSWCPPAHLADRPASRERASLLYTVWALVRGELGPRGALAHFAEQSGPPSTDRPARSPELAQWVLDVERLLRDPDRPVTAPDIDAAQARLEEALGWERRGRSSFGCRPRPPGRDAVRMLAREIARLLGVVRDLEGTALTAVAGAHSLDAKHGALRDEVDRTALALKDATDRAASAGERTAALEKIAGEASGALAEARDSAESRGCLSIVITVVACAVLGFAFDRWDFAAIVIATAVVIAPVARADLRPKGAP